MKTISVKEAAEALGVSPRAVQYKLQNGDLKGTRTKNQYGVAEWRVWPTKEIAERLKQPNGSPPSQVGSEELNFEPAVTEAIDAESTNLNELPDSNGQKFDWLESERERLKILAEEMTRPLVETIRAQERQIEEQNRQLRLLPDLQKSAEEERKAAELKALEAAALRKQIAALEEESTRKDFKLEKVSSLESQVITLSEELQRLQQPWWNKVFGMQK